MATHFLLRSGQAGRRICPESLHSPMDECAVLRTAPIIGREVTSWIHTEFHESRSRSCPGFTENPIADFIPMFYNCIPSSRIFMPLIRVEK